MVDQNFRLLKGFRDLDPRLMLARNYVLDLLKENFALFNFQPLQTPSLEYAATLLDKYGPEAERLIYSFKDRGDRQIGLIYDLTLPTARYLAQNAAKINFPFRRWQIQSVWRAEKPQKGRWREFTQCDIDIFGVTQPPELAEAEILSLVSRVYSQLGFKNFSLRVNNRPLLFNLLEKAGINEKKDQLNALKAIDKLDKKSPAEVKKEMAADGLNPSQTDAFLASLSAASPDETLKRLFDLAIKLGVPENQIKFDPYLVRGLDYYTGPIIEVVAPNTGLGSLGGGGRYDRLIAGLGGPDIPATGFSFGLDRIIEALNTKNLLPDFNQNQVLVTVFSPELQESSLQLLTQVRKNNLPAEIYPDCRQKIGKQLAWANQKQFGWVIILGPDEIAQNQVTLKNLKTKEQVTGSLADLLQKLKG